MSRRHVINRESMLDGSFTAEVRRLAEAGYYLKSDAELEASLDETLAQHEPGADAWLFGYGSLIWNPVIHFAERRVGLIRGWHRRYCLWMKMGRGSPDCPGLMLALDRGGSCRGVAFRVAAADVRHEFFLTWRREMLSGAYRARWVAVDTEEGPVRAVTFTVNRSHDRYVRGLTDEAIAERIAAAVGRLGTCADYLYETTDHLRELGIVDPGLERLRKRVERQRETMII